MKETKICVAKRLENAYSFGSEIGVIRRELAGSEFIDFGFGDVSFDTPTHIKDAAKQAMDEGYTHYVLPTSGMSELRVAIAQKMKKDNGLDVNPDNEVIVTVGASEGISVIAFGIFNPGDEVILGDPCWTVWSDAIKTAEATPILIPYKEERDFRIDPEDIKKNITPKTKAIVLNSPNNPTASVLKKKDLEEIADIAIKNDLLVISDEVYEKIVFGEHKHHSIASLPEMKERTIVVNAFSKAYAMTGWRIGYCVVPEHLMNYMVNFHTQMVTCVNAISQKAALAALEGPQDFLEEARKTYEKRMKVLVKGLNSIDRIHCKESGGTFYVYPNVSEFPMNSFEFAKYIAKNAKVLLYPATAFGKSGEGYLRLSISKPTIEEIEEGLERIQESVKKI